MVDINRIILEDLNGVTLSESKSNINSTESFNSTFQVNEAEIIRTKIANFYNQKNSSKIDNILAKLPNPYNNSLNKIEVSKINTEEVPNYYLIDKTNNVEGQDVFKDITITNEYSSENKKSKINNLSANSSNEQLNTLSQFSQENMNDISEEKMNAFKENVSKLKKKYGKESWENNGKNISSINNETLNSAVNLKNQENYKNINDLSNLIELMLDKVSYDMNEDFLTQETLAEKVATENVIEQKTSNKVANKDIGKANSNDIFDNFLKKIEDIELKDKWINNVNYTDTDLMDNMYDVYFIKEGITDNKLLFNDITAKDDEKNPQKKLLKLLTSPTVLSSRITKISIPATYKNSEEKTLYNVTVARETGSIQGENKSSISFQADFGFYLVDIFNKLSNTQYRNIFNVALTGNEPWKENLNNSMLSNICNIYRYCQKSKVSSDEYLSDKFDIIVNLTPHSMFYNDYKNCHEYQMFVFRDCKFIGSNTDLQFNTESDGGPMEFTYDFIYKRLEQIRGYSKKLTPDKNIKSFKEWVGRGEGKKLYMKGLEAYTNSIKTALGKV